MQTKLKKGEDVCADYVGEESILYCRNHRAKIKPQLEGVGII